MAWPGVPATIADGTVLSASWLNQLTDCVTYLNAVGGLPNVAFPQWTTSSASTQKYKIRHRHRYLHLQYVTTNGACDFIKVYYNGTLVQNDGDPDAAQTYHIDLNALGLSVGTWYDIQVDTAFTGSGSMTLQLLWESSSATG